MRDDLPAPPVAERRDHVTTLHGVRLNDPYAWLKDEDWQQVMREPAKLRADVRRYLEAENAHTEAALADVAALRETLFAELKGRLKEDDSTVPAPDGPWSYYARYAPGGQHPIFCRRAGGNDGSEEVLLDGDARAAGHDYYRVAGCEHSPDHRRLAFAEDCNGSEIYVVRFRDLGSGELLPDELENAHGSCAWAADGETVFYTVLDDNHRPSRVYRHRLGTPAGDDALVYEEPDPGFFVGVDVTESRRFVVISTHDHTTSEVRLVDARDPTSPPRLVAPRERDVEYSVSHHGERLLVLTNAGGAEDFKVVEAPLATPGREHWRDVVGHRPGVLIVSMMLFAGHMVRLEREDALPRIVVTDLVTGAEHSIAESEEAYSLGLDAGYEFDTAELRYRYSSPTTPERTFDYDMRSRERVLRKEQEVPSGHDPSRYVARRLHATAPDGERVPITLLHLRGLELPAPVLLYGYGSYGLSIPASFATSRLSLVDRGLVYAIAHVRGGMECGYRWYRGGKLAGKHNTFDDFIAAAEHLVAAGIADPRRIACHGGSAGGLLVGAVANMRPDLFRAVVAEVPFVDVLNTMCDADLPLTPPEWPEWGNPIEDEAAFRNIRSYSPYDNVEAGDYPAIIATAGLTDPRVTYWEPAKWVAKLRATKTDDNPLLLRTNMSAGHAGAAGRYDRLEEVALVYAFVLDVFGMADAAPR